MTDIVELAAVQNGIVVNRFAGPPGFAGGISCDRDVGIGWSYDGSAFAAPSSPEPEPTDLTAHAALRRWEKECGGIDVGGMPVHTDDRSKMMIMGARVKAADDPGFTTQWKTAAGDFVTIDAATILTISDAVLAHVDACFAIEAAVLADIAAGEITSTAEIDAAFG